MRRAILTGLVLLFLISLLAAEPYHFQVVRTPPEASYVCNRFLELVEEGKEEEAFQFLWNYFSAPADQKALVKKALRMILEMSKSYGTPKPKTRKQLYLYTAEDLTGNKQEAMAYVYRVDYTRAIVYWSFVFRKVPDVDGLVLDKINISDSLNKEKFEATRGLAEGVMSIGELE